MSDQQARPGYQAIVATVRADIARGARLPGQRLPSVRALARELGVNVNTVARAYAELARDGSIESRRGDGSFIRARQDEALEAERRAEQLRSIMAEAVLRSLSLGHSSDEIERAVQDQLEGWRTAAGKSGEPHQGFSTIRFAGSHDLALELLATRLRHRVPPIDLQLDFTGSTAGLMALLLDQAQVAGCHLGDDARQSAADNIERMLPGRRLTLLTLAHRQQGLMLPPGNPRQIRGVRELASSDVTVALRQAGSGTRMLLERTLAAEGVGRSFAGQPVLSTHGEVAASIADGSADAGLGILASARTYGLDFIPLGWERYELVIPTELMELPAIGALLGTLRSSALKGAIDGLGGYDTRETGQATEIDPASHL